MSATTTREPTRSDVSGDDDNLHHIVTDTNPDRSLCGRDVSGHEWATAVDAESDPCVVCFHMDGRL